MAHRPAIVSNRQSFSRSLEVDVELADGFAFAFESAVSFDVARVRARRSVATRDDEHARRDVGATTDASARMRRVARWCGRDDVDVVDARFCRHSAAFRVAMTPMSSRVARDGTAGASTTSRERLDRSRGRLDARGTDGTRRARGRSRARASVAPRASRDARDAFDGDTGVDDARSAAPPLLTPPQRSMIEQMIALRTRLNERVAKSNQFAKFVEKTLLERDKDLSDARRALANASSEMETLLGMVREAKRAASAEETTRALDAVAARLERARTALRRDATTVDGKCLREVPVSFQGNASDVRLMGSFDDWTRGAHLSPEWSGHGDGMTDTFTAVLSLPPGTYEVKFLVDGEWRTTDDWPCVGEGFERNMLLEVR